MKMMMMPMSLIISCLLENAAKLVPRHCVINAFPIYGDIRGLKTSQVREHD